MEVREGVCKHRLWYLLTWVLVLLRHSLQEWGRAGFPQGGYHSSGFSRCLFRIGFSRFLFCFIKCLTPIWTSFVILEETTTCSSWNGAGQPCPRLSSMTSFRESFWKHTQRHVHIWQLNGLQTVVLEEKGMDRHNESTPPTGIAPHSQGPSGLCPPTKHHSPDSQIPLLWMSLSS